MRRLPTDNLSSLCSSCHPETNIALQSVIARSLSSFNLSSRNTMVLQSVIARSLSSFNLSSRNQHCSSVCHPATNTALQSVIPQPTLSFNLSSRTRRVRDLDLRPCDMPVDPSAQAGSGIQRPAVVDSLRLKLTRCIDTLCSHSADRFVRQTGRCYNLSCRPVENGSGPGNAAGRRGCLTRTPPGCGRRFLLIGFGRSNVVGIRSECRRPVVLSWGN
jgi:hypothetical protein